MKISTLILSTILLTSCAGFSTLTAKTGCLAEKGIKKIVENYLIEHNLAREPHAIRIRYSTDEINAWVRYKKGILDADFFIILTCDGKIQKIINTAIQPLGDGGENGSE